MADPDVSAYVDLELADVTAQDLIDQALADLEDKFPDWTPREGNTEVVLVEAFAREVEELVFAVNRLPGTLTEVLLAMFGVERDPGIAATAAVTFTTSNTGPITIPAGTTVQVEPTAPDGEPLTFTTDVDAISLTAGTVTVAATADTTSDDANGTPASTPAELLDSPAYVDSATIAVTGAGVDPEDGPALLDRGVVRLRRLVTTLVLPDHFTAAALEDVRVARATTRDLYDPAQTPPTGRGGHVTVAVTGPAGANLSAPVKAEIESNLTAIALAGLAVHVIDATTQAVAITATITTTGEIPSTDVVDAVKDALTAYLNPDVWPFGTTVYRNELISLIDGVPGVARVATLTTPAADLTLTGAAPLPVAGTLTITVVP